ncbi:ATP-binding protein [Pedobacter duraquae]|uniref:histidine kinase n=1 Tax=Pedobacter duraquae TaxID=425511 RepID=A0A4R6IP99_9SPHI|nr:ATP-binding protein [Pedobacter duraquae]TDO24083.1 light-regulated signal transduction histidine kinase (bacteriophytochrome) [Pedobacter duraquae]
MNTNQVDLTNCDKEPIHIPGRIQSHGFLIAIDIDTLLIKYVSLNTFKFIEVEAADLLDKSILFLEEQMIFKDDKVQLKSLLILGSQKDSYEGINPYYLNIKGQPFYLIISKSGAYHVLEFEPAILDFDIQGTVGRSISGILAGRRLISMMENTADEIKKIIGYDRVMVYKFHDDGHGEVIAEAKNEDLEPFYGLHYPASDIPKQARALYLLNYTRIIADVNTNDSAVITTSDNFSALDLTHSVLRAVSPIHIQYLKNMGVDSSFSISLITNGKLWGLIACHNYTPKFIDYKARESTKLIGQILSSALEYRQEEEDDEKVKLLLAHAEELQQSLVADQDFISALTTHRVTIKDVTHSTGVVICFEGRLYTLGQVPAEEEIKMLVAWLTTTMEDSVYHTSQLPEVFSPAKNFKSTASGILAAMLSKDLGEFVIWFKPEQITTVHWAGNPEKPMTETPDGHMDLSPRNSFESWAQIVENTSASWTREEIASVIKIRHKLLDVINKKANEIRALNERLKLAYEELDTFSYTISHDLRTPLTSIKSYTELVLATNKSLDEQGKMLLNRVLAGANKMAFLINEILKLARVGRSDLKAEQLDMGSILEEIKTDALNVDGARHVTVKIGATPSILGDPTLITQIFANLIGNAVKYSVSAIDPMVVVSGEDGGDEVIYTIKDNGIGIDLNYHDKVFELFKRMDNAKGYQGTGVGLAIVKRIVEKHNARIWFESELKVGTVFYVAFRK